MIVIDSVIFQEEKDFHKTANALPGVKEYIPSVHDCHCLRHERHHNSRFTIFKNRAPDHLLDISSGDSVVEEIPILEKFRETQQSNLIYDGTFACSFSSLISCHSGSESGKMKMSNSNTKQK